MTIRRQFDSCVGLIVVLLWSPMYAQVSDEKVLYRKGIAEGQEIVVTQGPFVPITALARLVPTVIADRGPGCFSLSIELRSDKIAPLRLWSGISWLNRGFQYDDLQILDLLVLPGRLVMVTTEARSTISVIQIELYGEHPYRSVGLQPASWSLISAFVAPPGRQLSAKLTYNENQKFIEVEVTDFLQNTRQHSFFEQKGAEWDFLRVKQRQEQVPATNPAGR